MSKFNLEKYKRGLITIEAQTMKAEKFINLLWKNDIYIKNLKRKNITTISFEANLKDYDKINDISKKTGTKIKIVVRKGVSFFMIKNRERKTFLGGIIIFGSIIYYLSTYIWNIQITTESNVAPYEIREQLKSAGISPGINKRKIDVYSLEENIIKNNKDIMWVRARIEGVNLNVTVAERQEPPNFIKDETPCEIVAKKDGEVIRLYSAAGTAAVQGGDVVKKGDILIKGEQGKEGGTYQVHAIGEVIAKTFYEEKAEVPIKYADRKRTGKEDKNTYIEIKGKKVYLKKAKNKFEKYDKVVIGNSFLKEEMFYEVEEEIKTKSIEQVREKTANELFSNIIVKLDKSVKIVDKIIDCNKKDSNYEVRVVLVVEEDIAEPKAVEPWSEQIQESDDKKDSNT